MLNRPLCLVGLSGIWARPSNDWAATKNFFMKCWKSSWTTYPNTWRAYGGLLPKETQRTWKERPILSKESWVTWEYQRSRGKRGKWRSSVESQICDWPQAFTQHLN